MSHSSPTRGCTGENLAFADFSKFILLQLLKRDILSNKNEFTSFLSISSKYKLCEITRKGMNIRRTEWTGACYFWICMSLGNSRGFRWTNKTWQTSIPRTLRWFSVSSPPVFCKTFQPYAHAGRKFSGYRISENFGHFLKHSLHMAISRSVVFGKLTLKTWFWGQAISDSAQIFWKQVSADNIIKECIHFIKYELLQGWFVRPNLRLSLEL